MLLVAGCGAGLIAGYFAVDAGIILVPILLVWYKSTHVSSLVASHLAIGTALIVASLIAAEAAYADRKEGFVVWPQAIPLAGAGVVGAVLGAMIARTLPAETMTQIFAAAMLVTGIQLFVTRRKPKGTSTPAPRETVKLVAYGAIAGIIGAFTSTGNKLAARPLLYTQLRVPMKRSIGTANAGSAVFFFAAGVSFLFAGMGEILLPSFAVGYLDFYPLLPLSLGAVVCSSPGRRFGETHPMRNASLVFGILLLGLSFKLLVAP